MSVYRQYVSVEKSSHTLRFLRFSIISDCNLFFDHFYSFLLCKSCVVSVQLDESLEIPTCVSMNTHYIRISICLQAHALLYL